MISLLPQPPRVGDMVIHKYDKQRGFHVPGLVLRCRGIHCLVQWPKVSVSEVIGWHMRVKLEVVSEAG